MFAGVSASSMPAVKQFFRRQNFSPRSWKWALKSNSTSRSAREKITERSPRFMELGGDTHAAKASAESWAKDLESGGGERGWVKASRPEGSQILLTRDISVIQEQLSDASDIPVVTAYLR